MRERVSAGQIRETADSDATTAEQIAALLAAQPLASLGTSEGGSPYLSLVAIAAERPAVLYFATTRATRKWANLTADPRVSLLVDNRSGRTADFHEATAATGVGTAAECAGDEAARGRELLLARHPHLREFLSAPSTAVMCVRIERWYVVTRFQSVARHEPAP